MYYLVKKQSSLILSVRIILSNDYRDVSLEDIILRRRRIRRELLERPGSTDIRIAVLGGTTTTEVVDFLEILLLQNGHRPVFYQSDYGRYFETAVLEPEEVAAFRPDLVYIHTSIVNLQKIPPVSCTEMEFASFVDAEVNRYRSIWGSLAKAVGCQIIQNNFEFPDTAILGNLDAISYGGRTRFVLEVNRQFALEAVADMRLTIQDLCSISARVGLNQWFDPDRWFRYKLCVTEQAAFAIASSLAALVAAMYGRARKVLVLDLDNTLWGGVIGDDGPDKIMLGRETPIAEAYIAFQEYCLSLRERGVLLAVCSKNNEEVAKEGFSHPDSVLKLEHFSAFKANWEPKHESIFEIAKELNLGVDSFVFIDDNPAERAIVAAQIPGIAVPDVGSDVTRYAAIIESKRYFEQLSLGKEDITRAKLYDENIRRAGLERQFANYEEYLDSLEMRAEIDDFSSIYVERITQLTNKSNQFNLTTRRYTLAEIETAMNDREQIGLYGKLIDRFGDNGLISVVLGAVQGAELHVDLWLMSCRVLKREMELAMLDVLVERAKERAINRLIGCFIPSAKNGMVADHYQKLGFTLLEEKGGGSTLWSLDLARYQPRSRHIQIMEYAHG